MSPITNRSYLYDFDPLGLVEVCRDPNGVRVELFELTGFRDRDADELLRTLREDLAARFVLRPLYRRIIVWTHARWLKEHDEPEYLRVREWLDQGLLDMQHPWELPMLGQVACAVLQHGLPPSIENLRVGDPWDFDYERERPPERRAARRR